MNLREILENNVDRVYDEAVVYLTPTLEYVANIKTVLKDKYNCSFTTNVNEADIYVIDENYLRNYILYEGSSLDQWSPVGNSMRYLSNLSWTNSNNLGRRYRSLLRGKTIFMKDIYPLYKRPFNWKDEDTCASAREMLNNRSTCAVAFSSLHGSNPYEVLLACVKWPSFHRVLVQPNYASTKFGKFVRTFVMGFLCPRSIASHLNALSRMMESQDDSSSAITSYIYDTELSNVLSLYFRINTLHYKELVALMKDNRFDKEKDYAEYRLYELDNYLIGDIWKNYIEEELSS